MSPGAHALALLAGVALGVAAVGGSCARCAARRRAGLPAAAQSVLAGVLDPLGDAVLVLGRDGRIARANAAAARLAGWDATPLVGKDVAVAEALAVLRHGLARAGATKATVSLRTGVRARAALVRAGTIRSVDVVVLRAELARAAPPPLPRSRADRRPSRRRLARSSPARPRA